MAALVTALAAGCSAPPACHRDDVAFRAEAPPESAVLTARGQSLLRAFEATVDGLPELWSEDGAIPNAAVLVELSVRYEDSSPFAGTNTEMPRVQLTLSPRDDGQAETTTTPNFPFTPTQSTTLGARAFPDCFGQQQAACCPFGARSCATAVAMKLERLDGPPFPAVQLDWKVSLTATVDRCPLSDGTPTVRLAPVPTP